MAKITSFEDIDAWKKGRILSRENYRHTKRGEFAHDFALRDQIRKSVISILSNIAEGFERGGDKEFRQFLATAKGSAGELRSQLYIVLEVSRMISGLMRYLAQSELDGSKYKL